MFLFLTDSTLTGQYFWATRNYPLCSVASSVQISNGSKAQLLKLGLNKGRNYWHILGLLKRSLFNPSCQFYFHFFLISNATPLSPTPYLAHTVIVHYTIDMDLLLNIHYPPKRKTPKIKTLKKNVNALGPTDVGAFIIIFIALLLLGVNIKLTYCLFLGTASPISMIQSDLCFISNRGWSITRLWELWQLLHSVCTAPSLMPRP